MMTRRGFLTSLAGAVALGFAREERVIRVGQVASAEAALRGAQLGAEEAARTAELLGARFELHVGKTDGVLALVGGLDRPSRAEIGDMAERLGVPFLTTRSPDDTSEDEPLRRHVFHVASSPADRRAALARWGREGEKVVDWHPTLSRFGAEQLNQRFESRFGAPMDSLAWASWMAVKIAAEAALRSVVVERLRFDGHKGERLWFRPEDHGLRQPLYVVAGDRVVGEVAPEEE